MAADPLTSLHGDMALLSLLEPGGSVTALVNRIWGGVQ